MSDVTKYKLVMDKQRDIRISDRQLPVAYTVLKNALHMHSVVIKNEQFTEVRTIPKSMHECAQMFCTTE